MTNRITIKRGNKWLIPKSRLAEASAKLARFEDAEELDEVNEYRRVMRSLAKAEKKNGRHGYAKALEDAAAKIIQLNTFDTLASGIMAGKVNRRIKAGERLRKEIFDFLDDIDGQLIDDPVFVIREKLEVLLG